VGKPSPPKSPLEPIASAVGCATGLFVLVMLLSLFVHQASWGNGPVCSTVSPNDASLFSGPASVSGLAAGTKASLATIDICANHPTAALRFAGLAAAWPYTILWGIFLFRLARILSFASEPGALYSVETAVQLRGIGWLMTGGGIAASIVASIAKIFIFTRLVHFPGLGWFAPWQVDFSVWTLIIGLALISIARIMRLGPTMRDELDVTV
jgi:hypothetical protein